jgi:hypothetical protein
MQLQDALAAHTDKISRKTSALNKYIFDDIKEVDGQEEEDGSFSKDSLGGSGSLGSAKRHKSQALASRSYHAEPRDSKKAHK